MPHPRRAWTVVNVEVLLQHVADLTQVSQQRILDTNVQELTGDWRGFEHGSSNTSVQEPVGIAPTQRLGAALFDTPRLEGFLAVSAKVPYHRNLVVFPEKLKTGSRLVFHHPESNRTQVVEPRPGRQRRSRETS